MGHYHANTPFQNLPKQQCSLGMDDSAGVGLRLGQPALLSEYYLIYLIIYTFDINYKHDLLIW